MRIERKPKNEEIEQSVRDTDGDDLQDAEEEYGWTVERDINGDGDMDDTIQYRELLYRRETLLPRGGEGGEGAEIWSSWNNGDTDGDGIWDAWEKEYHTHPMSIDTDYDGLSDHYELNTWLDKGKGDGTVGRTDPHMADTDYDGLKDKEEVDIYRTNPINDDTDGDDVQDGDDMDPLVDLAITVNIREYLQKDIEEYTAGRDSETWTFYDLGGFFLKISVDGEWEESARPGNISDIIILSSHEYPRWKTTWDIPDDAEEVPIKIELWDDDGDTEEQMDISGDGQSCDIIYDLTKGIWTGDDYLGDPNGYGHVSGDEDGSTNRFDYDADVWFDITLNDYDGDGMPTKYEVENGLNPAVNDGEDDADGDGMTNYFECKYGFDMNDPSDAEEDADGDGLLNVWECQLGNRNPRDTRNVFKISLTVSLEWDADENEIQQFKDAFKGASLYLMTVTDGYVYISDVTIYNDGAHWNDVNIRVEEGLSTPDNDVVWPNSPVNGYWDGINTISWNEISIPQRFKYDNSDTVYTAETGGYYSMLVHEIGHYVFGFSDEYGYYYWGFKKYDDNGYTIDWNSLMQNNLFYMSYHQWYDTWFSNHPDYPETAQWHDRGMSCWEWFVQHMGKATYYSALIDFSEEAMSEDYVPYTISNPSDAFGQGYYTSSPPMIDVNYAFSYVSRLVYAPQYLHDELPPEENAFHTYSEIYETEQLAPNMDITHVMNIEVIS